MPFDSDVGILGTGVAPLVAAAHLLSQGKSVLLLNPSRDFFLENSELPLDFLLPVDPSPARIARSAPERALEELRPEFPGAVEFWSEGGHRPGGFHDPLAPHVRQRSGLWVHSRNALLEKLEARYLENSIAGLKPQLLDGAQATARFPGCGRAQAEVVGMLVPKLCDVDVARYRNGLLEFVRERLGTDRLICNAGQIQLIPEGLRFYANRSPHTARLRDGALVFWTPSMTQWVLSEAKRAERSPKLPRGARSIEEWSLLSRDPLDPRMIGAFRDMCVWAELEGAPGTNPHEGPLNRLSVLKVGNAGASGSLSQESFQGLSELCHGFLGWDRFTIRSMRPRTILEWADSEPWSLAGGDRPVQVVPGCEGYLTEVVRTARSACERLFAS